MKSIFNAAALAALSKSQLYALLTHYRRRLNRAGEAQRPVIKAVITNIQIAIARLGGPG